MWNIKHVAFGLALVTVAGAAGAQATGSSTVPPRLARDIRQDRRDIHQDSRDIAADRRDLRVDEKIVGRDIRNDKPVAAKRELRDALADRKDLSADRKDVAKDRKDLHHDVSRAKRIGG